MKYLRYILKFVKPYKWIIILSLFLSFLFVLLNTLSLWMISSLLSNVLNPNAISSTSSNSVIQYFNEITNSLIGGGDKFYQLKILCIALFVVYLFKNIFLLLSDTIMSFVNNKIIMNIRIKIFEHIQFLPLTFFQNNNTGSVANIILFDAARMRVAVIDIAKKLSKHPLNLMVMLSMLFLINVKMTIISLIMIPLVSIVVTYIGKSIKRKTKRSSIATARLISLVNENISGVKMIKSFLHENSQIKKFIDESKKVFNLTYKYDRLLILTTPINDMIGVIIAISLLWIGGNEVFNHGSMSPDDFIKFIIFLFSMMKPAKELAAINIPIQTSIGAAERVFEILDLKKQKELPDATIKESFDSNIILRDVSFSYDNYPNALKNISIEINKGKTYAIVGKSGAGKSTLINLITRFYEPSGGKIEIDNRDYMKISLASIRKLISIVPQESFLFNDTIRNNIMFGKIGAGEEEIINAAKKANAYNFIKKLPDKFDTIVGERGTKLSGGQCQRISIARAILKDSPIIIFDEATASLDSDSEEKVHHAINNLIENKTVIIIAHRLSTIINSNQIIVLDDGGLIEQGNHLELLKKSGAYKSLYELQYKNIS